MFLRCCIANLTKRNCTFPLQIPLKKCSNRFVDSRVQRMSCLVYDTSIKTCNFNIQLLNCLPATNSSPLKYSMVVKWGWISWHHWHYYSPGTTTYRVQHISIFIYIFLFQFVNKMLYLLLLFPFYSFCFIFFFTYRVIRILDLSGITMATVQSSIWKNNRATLDLLNIIEIVRNNISREKHQLLEYLLDVIIQFDLKYRSTCYIPNKFHHKILMEMP